VLSLGERDIDTLWWILAKEPIAAKMVGDVHVPLHDLYYKVPAFSKITLGALSTNDLLNLSECSQNIRTMVEDYSELRGNEFVNLMVTSYQGKVELKMPTMKSKEVTRLMDKSAVSFWKTDNSGSTLLGHVIDIRQGQIRDLEIVNEVLQQVEDWIVSSCKTLLNGTVLVILQHTLTVRKHLVLAYNMNNELIGHKHFDHGFAQQNFVDKGIITCTNGALFCLIPDHDELKVRVCPLPQNGIVGSIAIAKAFPTKNMCIIRYGASGQDENYTVYYRDELKEDLSLKVEEISNSEGNSRVIDISESVTWFKTCTLGNPEAWTLQNNNTGQTVDLNGKDFVSSRHHHLQGMILEDIADNDNVALVTNVSRFIHELPTFHYFTKMEPSSSWAIKHKTLTQNVLKHSIMWKNFLFNSNYQEFHACHVGSGSQHAFPWAKVILLPLADGLKICHQEEESERKETTFVIRCFRMSS